MSFFGGTAVGRGRGVAVAVGLGVGTGLPSSGSWSDGATGSPRVIESGTIDVVRGGRGGAVGRGFGVGVAVGVTRGVGTVMIRGVGVGGGEVGGGRERVGRGTGDWRRAISAAGSVGWRAGVGEGASLVGAARAVPGGF